jgi:AMP nucleosidase
MRSKLDITQNWLPRYTGMPREDFQEYILLTNFHAYLRRFSERYQVPLFGSDRPMQSASSPELGITIVNFGIGSANAALIMDLLGAVKPKSCLFLGKCGGLKKKTQIGDLILPIAAMRGEGTSDDYFDPKVPALPSFKIQKEAADIIQRRGKTYWTGTVFTTNRRVWEHDQEFREYLTRVRAIAVDMELATLFMVGFANDIPKGAILLVSDQPLTAEGIKTEESDKRVNEQFLDAHLEIGLETLSAIRSKGESMKHLRF